MWKKPTYPEATSTSKQPTIENGTNDSNRALVGPSITITGGLAGEEDVMIQGRVDGTVEFRQHNVTVGEHGRVKADIYAREIRIEGLLEGNLYGETKVEISKTGKVTGNIQAPRVVMEDGCKFKGRIDMDASAAATSNSEHEKTLGKIPPIAQTSTSALTDQKSMDARKIS